MKQVFVRNHSLQGENFEPLLTPRMIENGSAQQSCNCQQTGEAEYHEIPHSQATNAQQFTPLLTPRLLEMQEGQ